jgi:hypothetical protein
LVATSGTAPARRMVERPVYAMTGEYAGTEWVEEVDVPQMSYGEQMRHVGQVFVGVGKGAVNGVPVMVTEIGKGWMYVGSGLNDAFNHVLGDPTDLLGHTIDSLSSVSGQVLPYGNVEQRAGGFVGELASPSVYAKATTWTLQGGRLFASAAGETLFALGDAYMSRMGLQLNAVPRSVPMDSVDRMVATAVVARRLERLGYPEDNQAAILHAIENGEPVVIVGENMKRVESVGRMVDSAGGQAVTYLPRNWNGVTRNAKEANRSWLRYWAVEKQAPVIDIGRQLTPRPFGPSMMYGLENRSLHAWDIYTPF